MAKDYAVVLGAMFEMLKVNSLSFFEKAIFILSRILDFLQHRAMPPSLDRSVHNAIIRVTVDFEQLRCSLDRVTGSENLDRERFKQQSKSRFFRLRDCRGF
jgi:hypothetical protein